MIFSPGKLLLTSEYAVLDGAKALALPTKWGQELFVEPLTENSSRIHWKAFHQHDLWLDTIVDYQTETIINSNNPEAAAFVLKVIQTLKHLQSVSLTGNKSWSLKTNLQFPANYGLGSSSTLMNNLAQWAGVDAFDLNEKCLGGSGYDIAVAQQQEPILYTARPVRTVEPVALDWPFKEELIFIHLNQKQNSREGISLYRSRPTSEALLSQCTEFTERARLAQDLETISQIMTEHEQTLADFLGLKTVKEQYFSDCPAFVKSLGAWGGDFVMSHQFGGYREYFAQRGFSTVFKWNEIIL